MLQRLFPVPSSSAHPSSSAPSTSASASSNSSAPVATNANTLRKPTPNAVSQNDSSSATQSNRPTNGNLRAFSAFSQFLFLSGSHFFEKMKFFILCSRRASNRNILLALNFVFESYINF